MKRKITEKLRQKWSKYMSEYRRYPPFLFLSHDDWIEYLYEQPKRIQNVYKQNGFIKLENPKHDNELMSVLIFRGIPVFYHRDGYKVSLSNIRFNCFDITGKKQT